MTSKSERFEMRVDEDTLERVDKWRSRQDDVPSRAEAMRRLVERGLTRASTETVTFTDGEKLLAIMLRDIYKHLKVTKGEIDPDFVGDVIWGGHYWAPKWELPGLYHNHEDDPQDVRFVMNVMEMWDSLERGVERLSKKEKERIEKEADPFGKYVKFSGFDGNNEASLMGIAGFLVEKMDRFERFKGRSLNSHAPTITGYRRMLSVYEPMRSTLVGGELDSDQIIDILNGRAHPSRRGAVSTETRR
jgi:uncharacterized protein YfbU (UPF0304 family)